MPGEGDLLDALHRVQHRYGYVPKAAIPGVAQHLRLPVSRVYGAITFYSEFRQTPPPETTGLVVQRPGLLHQGRRRHPGHPRDAHRLRPGREARRTTSSACTWAVQRHLRQRAPGLGQRRGRRSAHSCHDGRARTRPEGGQEARVGRTLALSRARCTGRASPNSCPHDAQLKTQSEASRRRIDAADRARISVLHRHIEHRLGRARDARCHTRRGRAPRPRRHGRPGRRQRPLLRQPRRRVRRPDGARLLYQHVTADVVPAFLDALLVRRRPRQRLAARRPRGRPENFSRWPTTSGGRSRRDASDADMGIIDPENIDDSIAHGAYAGLDRALGMTHEEVIAEVLGLAAERPLRLGSSPPAASGTSCAPHRPTPRPWSATPTRATPAPGSTA